MGLGWAHFLLATAGAAGITSVLLVMMLSQPRVLLAMARDGLLPQSFFGDVHPRFRTPWSGWRSGWRSTSGMAGGTAC